MEITIRRVRRTDIDGMNRIFNEGMRTEGSCLDIDSKDYDYRLSWLAEHDKAHPVFVGEREGTLVCWAGFSRYSTDYPYDGVAYLDLYIDHGAAIPGLYESLLRFMEEQAVGLGFYKLITSVFANNRTALHRYRTAGFRDVGVFRNHGFYKGELVDMVYLERLLPLELEDLKTYYRNRYPFYEDFFHREEALQELQMLRNGMVRSPENPKQWIPAPAQANYREDWGSSGVTVRTVKNLPTLEELLEQKLAASRAEQTPAPETPGTPEQPPVAEAPVPSEPPPPRPEEGELP